MSNQTIHVEPVRVPPSGQAGPKPKPAGVPMIEAAPPMARPSGYPSDMSVPRIPDHWAGHDSAWHGGPGIIVNVYT
ncbi:MAG: hypothetical protein SV487_09310 [Thermodesulfobacteriota bacterium]|nr:hypothetical protein [Thermodesulfobacteriota bacterium]